MSRKRAKKPAKPRKPARRKPAKPRKPQVLGPVREYAREHGPYQRRGTPIRSAAAQREYVLMRARGETWVSKYPRRTPSAVRRGVRSVTGASLAELERRGVKYGRDFTLVGGHPRRIKK